jgi:hypothetical protein
MLVAVGILLEGSAAPLGVSFSSWSGIEPLIDESPPSLYLFDRPGSVLLDDPDVRDLPPTYAPKLDAPVQCLLREWYDERDTEYRRSFWLLG